MCPLQWKSSYELKGIYGLQGPTKKSISTSCLKQYTTLSQIKQTLYTQPGVTYAQITKQNSYTGLKKYDEPFCANKNYTEPPHNLAY
jgi:hypothetical protein